MFPSTMLQNKFLEKNDLISVFQDKRLFPIGGVHIDVAKPLFSV